MRVGNYPLYNLFSGKVRQRKKRCTQIKIVLYKNIGQKKILGVAQKIILQATAETTVKHRDR